MTTESKQSIKISTTATKAGITSRIGLHDDDTSTAEQINALQMSLMNMTSMINLLSRRVDKLSDSSDRQK